LEKIVLAKVYWKTSGGVWVRERQPGTIGIEYQMLIGIILTGCVETIFFGAATFIT